MCTTLSLNWLIQKCLWQVVEVLRNEIWWLEVVCCRWLRKTQVWNIIYWYTTYIYLIYYIIILYRCTLVDIVGAPKLSVRGNHNANGLDPDCRWQYLHWHLFRQKSRGVYNIAYHTRILYNKMYIYIYIFFV